MCNRKFIKVMKMQNGATAPKQRTCLQSHRNH